MQNNETKGMFLGCIGVVMFSLTLPFTRIAVAELSPYFVTFGRSTLGGICALILFAFTRPKLPTKTQLIRLSVMALGVVYGFPLFVSIAMKTLPSAHGGIVLGVLPLATAVVGAIRFKERPSLAFWITAATQAFPGALPVGGADRAHLRGFSAGVSLLWRQHAHPCVHHRGGADQAGPGAHRCGRSGAAHRPGARAAALGRV